MQRFAIAILAALALGSVGCAGTNPYGKSPYGGSYPGGHSSQSQVNNLTCNPNLAECAYMLEVAIYQQCLHAQAQLEGNAQKAEFFLKGADVGVQALGGDRYGIRVDTYVQRSYLYCPKPHMPYGLSDQRVPR